MSVEFPVVINQVNKALIATIPVHLAPAVLEELRKELLSRIADTSSEHVIFDFSAIELIDSEEYGELTNLFKMTSLMGTKVIIVGLSPGLAAMIVDLDLDSHSFQYGFDIEHGLSLAKDAQ